MARLIVDGFEGGLLTTPANGWTVGWLSSQAPRTTAKGNGGRRAVAMPNNNVTAFRSLPWNSTFGRPTRVREMYLAVANRQDGAPGAEVGVAVAGTTQAGVYAASADTRALRAITDLATGPGMPVGTGVFRGIRARVFVANSGGIVQLRSDTSDADVLNVTADTQNSATLDYADQVYLRIGAITTLGNNVWDDLIAQAPSILVDTANVPTIGSTLTIGGTATAVVSDYDFSTLVNGNAVKRIWLHGWNGVAFANGAAVTATGFAGNIIAPNARFINGFEPNSFWVESYAARVIYRAYPTVNGTPLQLVPVGSPVNVDNVNNNPETTASYNEATGAPPKTDRYTTITLPGWISGVHGIAAQPLAALGAGFTAADIGFTDPSGTRSFDAPLAATSSPLAYPQDSRADNAGWGVGDVTGGSITVELT